MPCGIVCAFIIPSRNSGKVVADLCSLQLFQLYCPNLKCGVDSTSRTKNVVLRLTKVILFSVDTTEALKAVK